MRFAPIRLRSGGFALRMRKGFPLNRSIRSSDKVSSAT